MWKNTVGLCVIIPEIFEGHKILQCAAFNANGITENRLHDRRL